MLLEVLKHTAQVNVSDLYITRGIETHTTGKCI